jgi:putative phosphoribosyl transferase
MHVPTQPPMFENRYDAGRKLAEKLAAYKGKAVVVLAIPNGGVPVALGVALALDADLNLIVSRKIPLPLRPEGGFGAITDDGTMILNDETVRKAGLTPDQITYQAAQVRKNIAQRSLLYHKDLPPPAVAGKTVIVVDDGLASGYTMMAAVESVRKRRPKEIIAAVPVASGIAFKEVEKRAKVVACTVGTTLKFYLADYYCYWNEPGEDEVLNCLREWRLRHTKPIIASARDLKKASRDFR